MAEAYCGQDIGQWRQKDAHVADEDAANGSLKPNVDGVGKVDVSCPKPAVGWTVALKPTVVGDGAVNILKFHWWLS
jgi:hypothetical protein